ncbi:MAG: ABC transporter permease [Actinobacteria bacterium]|nr:ABC transporter permease [Actinomycetota bacterium]
MNRRAVFAQTRAELVLMSRQGEVLLLTMAIPVILLVFFSQVDLLPRAATAREPVDALAPGILALAIMSSSMVSLAIGTGFERQYGVLKRLGASPLGRPALLLAKTAVIVTVEVVQIIVLSLVAFALGWRPGGNPLLALGAMLLASVAFAGVGLFLAGTLSGLMTLAAANGLYLILLLIGGMVFPIDRLPATLESLAKLLPAAALAEAVTRALDGSGTAPAQPWIVLAVWATAAPALATRFFRWD